jgi:hypothetical protein
VPIPNSPWSLSPQVSTVPLERSATPSVVSH